MPPTSGELWEHHLMPQQVDVDCLLPTGVIVPLLCSRDSTLETIKKDLWLEARKYPLFHKLMESESYIFLGITQDAMKEEFYDETRRLCDLRLFQPILKVMEPKGNRQEKMLNYEIGMLIGVPVNEFNENKDLEVITFRRNILKACKDVVDNRDQQGDHTRALYAYPPDIDSSEMPKHLMDKLKENSVFICVWVVSDDNNRMKYTVKVPLTAFPSDVIAETIRRRSRFMNMTKEHAERCIEEYRHLYVLKVCGCDQFLLAECPISQYKCIRESLIKESIAQLMLHTKESVYATLPETNFSWPSYVQRGIQALAEINQTQTLFIWEVQAKLRVKINCATYVNVKELGKIYIRACIYHGTEALCEAINTNMADSSSPRWDQWLEFLMLPDLPRSARLCLSICSESKRRNRKVQFALAWGNLQLFDFNKRHLTGKYSLYMWSMPQGMDDLLNPIGIPGSNPQKDCPCLEIEFDRFLHPLSYPPDSYFEQLANVVMIKEAQQGHPAKPTENELRCLDEIIEKDPLSDISEQDKALLWKLREICLTRPKALPKLLSAVKWSDRESVALLYELLRRWPIIPCEVALELLDCSYTDLVVREYAVKCLDQRLKDDKLAQYLLQLVQAIKYEPYLESPLTTFLLKRSLFSQRIGNAFFWHLKSEMHQTSTRLRFGLILEAYCRGCGPYIKNLAQQVEALDKLTKLSDMLKHEIAADEHMKYLHTQLQQPDYKEALQNLHSPLNTSHILGEINLEECCVKTSKKLPLWLVWSNPDAMADMGDMHYRIMFKNGDDLRQDMLTLQVIRIMDSIWKNEGLDLRLIPYGCLSTGKEVGVIEIVKNAKTITAIQSRGGTLSSIQIDSSQLHKWIKDQNPDRYEHAIELFKRSCAGYCVATFILGIGDRHPENIMVTSEGQVFHIDFGHFLDHKKKKFGINRERVPFVLTEDFLKVIAEGADKTSKHPGFKQFQELCGNAYLILRKHANLFITLFTMMLQCGIPELQSLDDIGYIRKTLAVEKTEEKALEYFQQQFHSAYGDSWTTKVDWFFHNFIHSKT
ncbi:phosphatidylinositol 4 5-bisphosphate 3-kinase catalytic subunit alpha isoform-like isoform X2 [Biomphalaria glabrata]|uniref:Phosphatidylinositol 4,5-bisphosphate 3-kinase catalytic subunit alpha isoform n=2 Tax=Biomphalaria TaxID=6525 RepID=A0A2C9JTG9_BIOGL|nr:phosphatidylinositol 4,5-bisphosphate 3-kinase catalytic subunit alpha isoform-like isoform X2 [Biomphalaria glabrata]KAI8737752.1 phosphatidylinositol 4; 5-bisphosphate 3-kinase catalytic subunit alpha isoform-like isoform X2 [Biomphalaria glabrata]KAI8795508.1 phosphatidylinositol 4,5-bisphosphate 3-kinase catalytic subunit alpha isoform isoform X2 [Biomphalaria glabrata]KAK0056860.1 phosphatidylinositol 4 5-bisphosphate 3-kinase catalytic subunit alpha isoform-like isoform X2 [Biomphalaria